MELENKKINSAEELREYLDELLSDIKVLSEDFFMFKSEFFDFKDYPAFDFEEDEIGTELIKKGEKSAAKQLRKTNQQFFEKLNNISKFNLQTSIVTLYSLMNDLYKNRKIVSNVEFVTEVYSAVKEKTQWKFIPIFYYSYAITDISLKQLNCLKMLINYVGAELGLDGYKKYTDKAIKGAISKLKNSTTYIDDGSYIAELKNV